MSALHAATRRQTRAFGRPTCCAVRSFLPVGMGKAYPLGTGWGSRLLLASGKLEDLHILTTSLSLTARLNNTI